MSLRFNYTTPYDDPNAFNVLDLRACRCQSL